MSDRLEEFVRQHREQFDLQEPDPSIWLKINLPGAAGSTAEAGGSETGSGTSRPGAGRGRTMRWLRIAAAVAVIFAGTSAGIWFLTVDRGSADQYSRIYLEMQETEQYYTRMVAQRYDELRPYLAGDPAASVMLEADFRELDEVYAELKEDLKDNVSNPEVIEAMILNYRVKLEILEDLLYQLKEKENQDYESEESHSL